MEHDLKVHSGYFAALKSGAKPFEVRLDDRGYAVGDALLLREWDPEREVYTGERLRRVVTYKMSGGRFGLDSGYCVLGLAEEWRCECTHARAEHDDGGCINLGCACEVATS